jgi:hypothetical protein
MNPLSRDHWLAFVVENRDVPILMKECPEPLIGDPFFGWAIAWHVPESDKVPWIHLIVVDNFSVGVNYRGPQLEALNLIRGFGSATTRRGILERGLLMERVGPPPLGELLGHGCGSTA